jgi:hypothetical protein
MAGQEGGVQSSDGRSHNCVGGNPSVQQRVEHANLDRTEVGSPGQSEHRAPDLWSPTVHVHDSLRCASAI